VREILSMVFQEFAFEREPDSAGSPGPATRPAIRPTSKWLRHGAGSREIPLAVGIKRYVDWFKKG